MTYHSITRTKERAHFYEASAIKMVERARERGKVAECFSAQERKYLESKEVNGKHALYYAGFCFIYNEDYSCVTMFSVPIWFGKRMNFHGKEHIRCPKKYVRNCPDIFDKSELFCFV